MKLLLAVLLAAAVAQSLAQPPNFSLLSPEERARAMQIQQKRQEGEPLTDDDRAFIQQMRAKMGQSRGPAAAAPTPHDRLGLTPLSDFKEGQKYRGQDGGLYGGGRNEPPAPLEAAALAAARQIVPLDRHGRPSPTGKVVFISIGMSNTTMEFSEFKRLADANPKKATDVWLVDCAQGGREVVSWSDPNDALHVWATAERRLNEAGATADQVEVAWLKQARAEPALQGAYPKHVQEFEGRMVSILQLAHRRFPNLRLVYLSSRIYAGYATTPLNPEPYAYEEAFGVRDLILRQMKGDPALPKEPVLLWGPYLWADGLNPRHDGLIWKREDLATDGTHPSVGSGRAKVARQLLGFLRTEPTAAWFWRR
jgi:hypothetical protein